MLRLRDNRRITVPSNRGKLYRERGCIENRALPNFRMRENGSKLFSREACRVRNSRQRLPAIEKCTRLDLESFVFTFWTWTLAFSWKRRIGESWKRVLGCSPALTISPYAMKVAQCRGEIRTEKWRILHFFCPLFFYFLLSRERLKKNEVIEIEDRFKCFVL